MPKQKQKHPQKWMLQLQTYSQCKLV